MLSLARIRPTVLLLQVWMGVVVMFCCTQFGKDDSIAIIGAYVGGILATMNDILDDADDETAKIRPNILILFGIAGIVAMYISWTFGPVAELVGIVTGLVVGNGGAIKQLVRDEADKAAATAVTHEVGK